MDQQTSAKPETKDAFAQAVATIPSCALTEEGVKAQRQRMLCLRPSVAQHRREEDRVVIEFEPSFDRALLEETLAVERQCCPFFRFDFHESGRILVARVEDPEHRAGLDALTYALGIERSAA